MAEGYSDEVWTELKNEFEQGPKVSWKRLVEIVSERLGGCDMPSPSIVRRKSIAENWKKRVKNTVKRTASQLNREIRQTRKKLTSKDDTQDFDTQQETGEKTSSKNKSNIATIDVKNSKKSGQNPDYDVRRLNADLVIKNNRNRSAKLGELATDTIDAVIHIRDEVLKIDFDEITAKPEEVEQQLRIVKFKLGLIGEIVDLNLKQSITSANIARIDALYWGLDEEDLKDQAEQQAKRSAQIENSKQRMLEEKQRMQEAKKAAMAREADIEAMAQRMDQQGY